PQRLFAVSQHQTPSSFLFHYFLSFSSFFFLFSCTRPNFFLLFFSSFSFVPPTNSKLSERVRSGGKHLPPAAGKRAQVDFDPVSPSPFEEAPLPLLEGTFLCGFSSKILNFAPFLGFVTLSGLVMASADLSLIMRDHLYSLDDRLKRGRPPPLLKSAYEGIIIDGEPAPETAPVPSCSWGTYTTCLTKFSFLRKGAA
ncbi:unnamed protein product, partial [Prunus brigantina]